MLSQQRFLKTIHGQSTDYTPVWIMRQAGRYLPEYRDLKERYSFLHMVKTPELACEVTLQPLARFDFDAAILFSDILIIPEALGQPYFFKEGGGIGMEFIIDSQKKIEALCTEKIAEKTAYMGEALRLVKKEIGEKKALLGFGGSPWTLASYMTEGGSLKNLLVLKELFYSQPQLFEALMEKITKALIALFTMQIEAGVDAIQIFDSAGSWCPAHAYEAMSLRWIQKIISALPKDFPVILFAKGMSHQKSALLSTGAKVLSLDWSLSIPSYRSSEETFAIQGNLDPLILSAPPEVAYKQTRQLLLDMQGQTGHILNLGHGILPSARIESVEALCQAVKDTPKVLASSALL